MEELPQFHRYQCLICGKVFESESAQQEHERRCKESARSLYLSAESALPQQRASGPRLSSANALPRQKNAAWPRPRGIASRAEWPAVKDKIPALLLHDALEPFASLKPALARLSVEGTRVRTCQEAQQRLERTASPHLVFTDVTLPDGTWKEVVDAAALAPATASVIVVNRFPDDSLYVDAIDRGASDFITPPFDDGDLAHVVATALQNLIQRGIWQTLARSST